MKTLITIFSTIILIFLLPIKSFSQNTHIYKHPSLNFQFKASKNWIKFPRPEDKLIYEMMSPDSSIHVMLWYTETEQSAINYLTKMAGMKDLIIKNEEPYLKTINNQDLWILNVPGYERKIPVRTLLAVTAHGMSTVHPRENRLFIIQIWCHKDNYNKYKSIFEDILNSVQIK